MIPPCTQSAHAALQAHPGRSALRTVRAARPARPRRGAALARVRAGAGAALSARKVRAVCAAFALGVAGSNACPPSYSRLGTEDMCKSAAAVVGKRFGGSAASSYYPSGCYWHTILYGVYFNPAAGGADNYFINITQPFCVGAPCGLP